MAPIMRDQPRKPQPEGGSLIAACGSSAGCSATRAISQSHQSRAASSWIAGSGSIKVGDRHRRGGRPDPLREHRRENAPRPRGSRCRWRVIQSISERGGRDAGKHHFADALGMLLGISQRQSSPPGQTEDQPSRDAEMLPQPLDIRQQMRRRIAGRDRDLPSPGSGLLGRALR